MSIETDLSVTPYFDDYREDKDYYKILFQPSVPVQVRELNQLQTLLQQQIETFGDHILQRGTVLEGCQFSFQKKIPYVKLRDTTDRNFAVAVSNYEGLFAKNALGKIAKINSTVSGFELQNPDLNTLYVTYLNDGTAGNVASFAADENLTIYNNDNRIEEIRVVARSSGFSNTDSIVVLSAIEVQNTTGGTTFSNTTGSVVFAAGDIITQSSTGANATVISVDTTANTQAVTLRIKPLTSDLQIANTDNWDFEINQDITVTAKGISDSVLANFVGQGANASLTTTGEGGINTVTMTNKGTGYRIVPHITVSTENNQPSTITALVLTADNFLANVTVSNSATNPIGFGYGVSVSEGVIYQKGHFLRTDAQSLIISKYNTSPDQESVGYVTQESIITSSQDTSLFDNSAGFLNENAPGADRLQLVPILTNKTKEEAEGNSEYLPLVNFSEGRVFSILENTQYDKLGDELARRTYEESGNYVLDRFNLQTRSTLSIANTDSHFSYVIDPGHAYINGKRVQTIRNYSENVEKGTRETTLANANIDIYYGNYIRVSEFAGFHNFTTGSQIELHSTAKNYLSTSIDIAIATPGAKIGDARVRSIIHENGIEGTPEAIYRVYLFDVKMSQGKKFFDVKSIFVAGAIGDLILEPVAGATSGTGAVMKETNRNSLLFDTVYPLKSVANVDYQYRSTATNVESSTAGIFTLSADTNATWNYSGALSFVEERELIITPEEDFIDTLSLGTWVSSTTGVLTASASAFLTTLSAGDYIKIGATTVLVKEVVSDTVLNYLPTSTLSTGALTRCYPTGVPIPLSGRPDATATVTGSTLTVDMDINISAAANVSVVYNQRADGTSTNSVAKTAVRNVFVKINTDLNAAGSSGPWCLGHSDIIRLRNVYLGSASAVDETDTNVTDQFYIDANHTENYYDLGSLHLKYGSSLSLENKFILVEFDYTSHSGQGVKTVSSYTVEDGVALTDLTANVNTLEIPEFVGGTGNYHDLREAIDFRPVTSNTVTANTAAADAPVNPLKAVDASRFAGTIKFPAPESDMFCSMVFYNPRKDIVIAKDDQSRPYTVLTDVKKTPTKTASELNLYEINVPAYPTLPGALSTEIVDILETGLAGSSAKLRRQRYTTKISSIDDQAPGYTMEEIGKLERRIATLEYYVNLSETEDQVKDKTIPSSVDSTLERFKFGFFVDNFTSASFTDLAHPEQNTTFFGGLLLPASESYNIKLNMDENTKNSFVSLHEAKLSSDRRKIISQNDITDGPVIVDIDPPPPEITVCNTEVFISNHHRKNANNGTVFEENTFTLSSNADADGMNITIEFDLYGGKDRFEIFQSSSPSTGFTEIYNSQTLTPTNITPDRRRQLQNKDPNYNINKHWAPNWTGRKDFAQSSKDAVQNYWTTHIGVLTFPYNASAGRYLKVRVVKASWAHEYYITYPRDCLNDIQLPVWATNPDRPPSPSNPVIKPPWQPTYKPPTRPVRWPICIRPVKTPVPIKTPDTGLPKTNREDLLGFSPSASFDPPPVTTQIPIVQKTKIEEAVQKINSTYLPTNLGGMTIPDLTGYNITAPSTTDVSYSSGGSLDRSMVGSGLVSTARFSLK